jgi:hypothetical protein
MIKRLLSAAWLILAASAPGWAQNNFPTPGGATAGGDVGMCLNAQSLAVPCSGPGGGGTSIGSVLWPVTTSPTAVAPTAGAFSSILAASTTRKGCLIQNVGTTLGYVYFGANGSATTSNTFQVAANGGTINCADAATIDQSNVSATCASGTCAFIVKAE